MSSEKAADLKQDYVNKVSGKWSWPWEDKGPKLVGDYSSDMLQSREGLSSVEGYPTGDGYVSDDVVDELEGIFGWNETAPEYDETKTAPAFAGGRLNEKGQNILQYLNDKANSDGRHHKTTAYVKAMGADDEVSAENSGTMGYVNTGEVLKNREGDSERVAINLNPANAGLPTLAHEAAHALFTTPAGVDQAQWAHAHDIGERGKASQAFVKLNKGNIQEGHGGNMRAYYNALARPQLIEEGHAEGVASGAMDKLGVAMPPGQRYGSYGDDQLGYPKTYHRNTWDAYLGQDRDAPMFNAPVKRPDRLWPNQKQYDTMINLHNQGSKEAKQAYDKGYNLMVR